MAFLDNFRRVNRDNPCPICHHTDWCAVAKDGSIALCQRVESSRHWKEAGWLHRLVDAPWRPGRRTVRTVRLATPGNRRDDLDQLAVKCQRAVDPGRLHRLAVSLGLSADSLTRLSIGWSEAHRAWSFPMRDAAGAVLGIRLRYPDGKKLSVKGGKEGLFVPRSLSADNPLLVCEGPSDTAALLDMGFAYVVGRPSCTGGIRLVVELVQARRCQAAVLVADADEPGRRGADNLASVLRVYVPAVKVIGPPANLKDVRDWLRTGGKRQDVEAAIAQAEVGPLAVRAREVHGGK
jgi:hypothetical protein